MTVPAAEVPPPEPPVATSPSTMRSFSTTVFLSVTTRSPMSCHMEANRSSTSFLAWSTYALMTLFSTALSDVSDLCLSRGIETAPPPPEVPPVVAPMVPTASALWLMATELRETSAAEILISSTVISSEYRSYEYV